MNINPLFDRTPQDELSASQRHALFSSALEFHKTPPLYAQENVEPHEKTAYARFYEPESGWSWYATEWDGKDLCFGYVMGFEAEWGPFDLREMAEVKTKFSQIIWMDQHFLPGVIPELVRDVPEPLIPNTTPTHNMSTKKQPNPPIQAIPTEHKELLLKLFKGTSVDLPDKSTFVKPLTDKEYDQIRNYIDRRRGGLTLEAHAVADKDLRKAAAISQVFKDHRVMDARMKEHPELRDVLLKALKAKPGEKTLTMEEFKDVVVFLDRKNGGLRHYAFNAYRKDADIVKAAQEHQTAWVKQEPRKNKDATKEQSQEGVPPEVGKVISKLQERIRSKSAGMTTEPGQGQEAER